MMSQIRMFWKRWILLSPAQLVIQLVNFGLPISWINVLCKRQSLAEKYTLFLLSNCHLVSLNALDSNNLKVTIIIKTSSVQKNFSLYIIGYPNLELPTHESTWLIYQRRSLIVWCQSYITCYQSNEGVGWQLFKFVCCWFFHIVMSCSRPGYQTLDIIFQRWPKN